EANTAFESRSDIGSFFVGRRSAPKTWRSSIITELRLRSWRLTAAKRVYASTERVMVRIPTHGPPTHPGEMILEEFLRPLGMTQTEFAQRIGVAWTRANQLIKGRRSVTPDTALRLERLFGMPADFWLTLQLRWDLYHAMR